MRIISGSLKGRNIDRVLIDSTRETSDMIRGVVFNMLYNIEGNVLDLFAGSGAYGIEAISRGAKTTYFNDINNKAYLTIQNNLNKLNLSNTKVFNLDYIKLIHSFKIQNIVFDYIFLDPPYNLVLGEEELSLISSTLKESGKIIYELHKDTPIKSISELSLLKSRTHGIKKILIYEKMIK